MGAAAFRAMAFAAVSAAALLAVGGSPPRDLQGNPLPATTLRGALWVAVAGLGMAGVFFVGALGGFALLRRREIPAWRACLLGAAHGTLVATAFHWWPHAARSLEGVAIAAAAAGAVALAGGWLTGRRTHV